MKKTFREYTYPYLPIDSYKPISDLNASTMDAYGSSGAGFDTFKPMVTGQKRQLVSKSQLDQVEKYADKILRSLKIDIEFSNHFLARLNDARNKEQITTNELLTLFKKSREKYGTKIKSMGSEAQAVIKDMNSDINLPFVLAVDKKNNELDFVAKTIMRKKDFKTTNPILRVENFKNFRDFRELLEKVREVDEAKKPKISDKTFGAQIFIKTKDALKLIPILKSGSQVTVQLSGITGGTTDTRYATKGKKKLGASWKDGNIEIYDVKHDDSFPHWLTNLLNNRKYSSIKLLQTYNRKR